MYFFVLCALCIEEYLIQSTYSLVGSAEKVQNKRNVAITLGDGFALGLTGCENHA